MFFRIVSVTWMKEWDSSLKNVVSGSAMQVFRFDYTQRQRVRYWGRTRSSAEIVKKIQVPSTWKNERCVRMTPSHRSHLHSSIWIRFREHHMSRYLLIVDFRRKNDEHNPRERETTSRNVPTAATPNSFAHLNRFMIYHGYVSTQEEYGWTSHAPRT